MLQNYFKLKASAAPRFHLNEDSDGESTHDRLLSPETSNSSLWNPLSKTKAWFTAINLLFIFHSDGGAVTYNETFGRQKGLAQQHRVHI